MVVDYPKVAGGDVNTHGADGGLQIVLDRNHVQTGTGRATNIASFAKAADDNPLPSPGELAQSGLRKPIWLLMNVDRSTSGGILGQHPGPMVMLLCLTGSLLRLNWAPKPE